VRARLIGETTAHAATTKEMSSRTGVNQRCQRRLDRRCVAARARDRPIQRLPAFKSLDRARPFSNTIGGSAKTGASAVALCDEGTIESRQIDSLPRRHDRREMTTNRIERVRRGAGGFGGCRDRSGVGDRCRCGRAVTPGPNVWSSRRRGSYQRTSAFVIRFFFLLPFAVESANEGITCATRCSDRFDRRGAT